MTMQQQEQLQTACALVAQHAARNKRNRSDSGQKTTENERARAELPGQERNANTCTKALPRLPRMP
eukprot:413598-Rhodomonas_salina.1